MNRKENDMRLLNLGLILLSADEVFLNETELNKLTGQTSRTFFFLRQVPKWWMEAPRDPQLRWEQSVSSPRNSVFSFYIRFPCNLCQKTNTAH